MKILKRLRHLFGSDVRMVCLVCEGTGRVPKMALNVTGIGTTLVPCGTRECSNCKGEGKW